VRTLLFGHSLVVNFVSENTRRLLPGSILVSVQDVADCSKISQDCNFDDSLDLNSAGIVDGRSASTHDSRIIVLLGSNGKGLGDGPGPSQRIVSLVSQESSDIIEGVVMLAVSQLLSQGLCSPEEAFTLGRFKSPSVMLARGLMIQAPTSILE